VPRAHRAHDRNEGVCFVGAFPRSVDCRASFAAGRIAVFRTRLVFHSNFNPERTIDIPHKTKRSPRTLKAAVGVTLLVAVTALGATYLQGRGAVESVAAKDLVLARVEKGNLERAVRAPGVVVPVEVRYIAARVEGRIESKPIEAGAKVHPDTLVLQMSDPTLSRNLDTARIELDVLESQSLVLEKQLSADLLAQEAVVADNELGHEDARVTMEANQGVRDVISDLVVRESEIATERFARRMEIEKTRLVRLRELHAAKMEANRAELKRGRRQLQLAQELVDALSVRAGIEGTLQDLPVEIGQQIAIGAVVARVAGDNRYKIELRVQEQQAKEIEVGQKAVISAGGQQAGGTVSRVDPSVQAGTVLVTVLFGDEALMGARTDLRVQGLIETAFAADTLVLQRPVFSEENSSAELFVLNGERNAAVRRTVQLGLASTDKVQVLSGLNEGDTVIVSDVSRFLGKQTIQLAE
jgi:HlyD family secretion protein